MKAQLRAMIGAGLAAVFAGMQGAEEFKRRQAETKRQAKEKPPGQPHGRHFNSAHISRAHPTSLKKLARAARRGEIDLMQPKYPEAHSWYHRPLAAKS